MGQGRKKRKVHQQNLSHDAGSSSDTPINNDKTQPTAGGSKDISDEVQGPLVENEKPFTLERTHGVRKFKKIFEEQTFRVKFKEDRVGEFSCV